MPEIVVPRGAGIVHGEVRYQLSPSVAGRNLHLLNFAEFLHGVPSDLIEIEATQFFDGPFNSGKLDVVSVVANGAALLFRQEGVRRDVVVEVPAGTSEITVAYRVRVPRRLLPFGCHHRRCNLNGAIAPLPSAPAVGGPLLNPKSRVIAPIRWSVASAEFGEPRNAVDDGYELVSLDQAIGNKAVMDYPTILWGPKWHRTTEYYRGVELTVLHPNSRPSVQHPDDPAPSTGGVLGGLGFVVRKWLSVRPDRVGRVLEIGREAIDTLSSFGLELKPDTKVHYVIGALRSNVAEFHPNVILVSDQAFDLPPIRKSAKFHPSMIGRATLDMFAHAQVSGRHEPSTDWWLGGMVGFAMTKAWEKQKRHKDEFAVDILGNFAFIPAVDHFLYSEQSEFSRLYFRGAEDSFNLRNHPLLFSHELPTGRRIHEKLKDLMSPEQFASFYRDLLSDLDGEPRHLAERNYGYTLDWFFAQWLGPYPQVEYQIVSVAKERLEGGWRYDIEIARDSKTDLIEPVQVVVQDRSGTKHHLIWNGDGEHVVRPDGTIDPLVRKSWSVQTQRRIKYIKVDPRVRSTETASGERSPEQTPANVDMKFNNRFPARARFLYTGLSSTIPISEFLSATSNRLATVSVAAMFEASLARDLSKSATFNIYKSREASAGVGGGMNFLFGEKVTKNRRRYRVRISAGFNELSNGGLDAAGGRRVSQAVSVADETRRYGAWPEQGHRISASASMSQIFRPDGLGQGDAYSASVGAAWTQVYSLAQGHTLVQRLGIGGRFPLAETSLEFRTLGRVGGAGGTLSAFRGDELFARGVASARLEYRHVLANNVGVNFGHLAWWRRIGGALNGGVATLSSCEDFSGWFSQGSVYGQVGYALMGSFRLLGVNHQLVRLDAGVPIGSRYRQRTCLGETFPDAIAVNQGLDSTSLPALLKRISLNLTFTQPF